MYMKKLFILLLSISIIYNTSLASLPVSFKYIDGRSIPESVYRHCVDRLMSAINENQEDTLKFIIDPVVIGKEIDPYVCANVRINLNIDLNDNQHRVTIKYFYHNLRKDIGNGESISFHIYRQLKFLFNYSCDYLFRVIIDPIVLQGEILPQDIENVRKEFNLDLNDEQQRKEIEKFHTSIMIPIDSHTVTLREYRLCVLRINQMINNYSTGMIDDLISLIISKQKIPQIFYNECMQEFQLDLSDDKVRAMIKYYFLS